MKNIAIIGFDEGIVPEETKAKFEAMADSVVMLKRDDADALEKVKDAEAFIVRIFQKIDKEIIDAAPNLKYIGVLATDYSYVDVEHANSKGIKIANLGGYSTEAVAEFVVAAILDHARHMRPAHEMIDKSDYSLPPFFGTELKGRKLGVIGTGRIGSRIVELFQGFKMDLVYSSRNEKPELTKIGAKLEDIDTIVSTSDYVVLAMALNDETKNTMSADRLGKLKQGVVFVNIAPNNLVDQEALLKKIENKELTYIFDHAEEMDEPTRKKYESLENCVIYPPVAFRTNESETARWSILASNLEAFIAGTPENIVN